MTLGHIPYGAYWSTPFIKWQGAFSSLHSIRFAAHTAKRELAKRQIDPSLIDQGVLGCTVPQKGLFYGLPWLGGLLGANHLAGPTIMQACATAARCLQVAALGLASNAARASLVVTADRISNSPHLYYPDPTGPGGAGESENWVLDNIGADPLTSRSMLVTAENVAKRFGLSTAQQHHVVLLRHAQYAEAIADDHRFQKHYMTLPFEVPDRKFAKTVGQLEGDTGIFDTSAEGLARLAPVLTGGTVTFGGQTHPADGNAGMLVCDRQRAAELSRRPEIRISILAFGQARADLAHMPMAPVPATKRALEAANLSMADIDAVKSHNPFAVNDLVFSRETGFAIERMNNFGCSLIYGHPQGPTGLRAIIELIEELVLRGGGTGLFQGCAAGDSAMAVILRVEDERHG